MRQRVIVFVLTTTAMFAMGVLTAAPLNDATIYAIFDQANTADISTARLGVKKAHHPKVRALAEMVRDDHLAVQQMGRELAAELGVAAMPPDDDDSFARLAEAYSDLQRLSGEDFDRAYLSYEIDFHASVINAINETLLPAINNPELKALVIKVLPGFEHHLAETRRIADELGI